MPHTTPRAPEESHLYPRFASDRADELIDELVESQCVQLFDALRPISSDDWFEWMAEESVAISQYDGLSAKQRGRQLAAAGGNALAVTRLHHACVFLALWQARLAWQGHMPSRGLRLDDGEAQRHFLLAAHTAIRRHDSRDLWPFEWPQTQEPWSPPFWDYQST